MFTPLPIKALHGLRIKQIACGDSHCLAVTMEGEVQRWVSFLNSVIFLLYRVKRKERKWDNMFSLCMMFEVFICKSCYSKLQAAFLKSKWLPCYHQFSFFFFGSSLYTFPFHHSKSSKWLLLLFFFHLFCLWQYFLKNLWHVVMLLFYFYFFLPFFLCPSF